MASATVASRAAARRHGHYGKIYLHFFRLTKVRFDPATPARARPDAKSPQARSRPPANPFPSNFASPSQVFIKCMSDVSCASDPDYDPDEDASESSGKLYDPSLPEPGIAPLSDVISKIPIIGS